VTGIGVQSLFGVIVVLGLVVGLAWLLRRGAFGALRPGSRAITVETAMPLGERRSLVIVSVEGRRLLLGMTPGQISMVTELDAAPPVAVEPTSGGAAGQSFEQLLVARAKEMFGRRGGSSKDSPPRQSFEQVLVARAKDMLTRRATTAETPAAASSNTRIGAILKLNPLDGERDTGGPRGVDGCRGARVGWQS
jgi:flagellar biosynthetic protein FliO